MDSTKVQYAINLQKDNEGGEVWIAKGIYHPTDTILGTAASGFSGVDSLRMRGFTFYPNVEVYGGFAGNETSLEERDIENNKTILSGDFSRNDEWLSDWAEGVSQGNLLDALQIALPDTALLPDTLLMSENAIHVGFIPPGTDSTCKLNGLVFANGYGRFGIQDTNGGGLFSSETSSPTVDSCVFVGNAAVDGGGAFVYDGHFTNCDFSNNATFRIESELNPLDGFGAGLYSSGGEFDDCLFSSNKAESKGGGIYCTGGTYNNSYILHNRMISGGQGAGIASDGNVTFSGCEIAYNITSPTGNCLGGGVIAYNDGYYYNCDIHDNQASLDVNGSGGGIILWEWGKAENCRIYNNKAKYGGGAYSGLACYYINCAIYNNEAEQGGGYFANSNGLIYNCTFVNNRASTRGGGLLINVGSSVKNTLIWNNYVADTLQQVYANNTFGGQPYLHNCAIQDTTFGNILGENSFYLAAENTGSNSSEFYAGLANPISFTGKAQTEEQLQELINADFSLTAISACINAGADDNNIPDLDLNGNPRIFEDIVDIGACEYQEEINEPMVIHINTNHSDGTTMELPLFGEVDVTVDWGDENVEDITTAGNASHTYSTEGIFTIGMNGSLTQFGNGFNGYEGACYIDSVSSFGDLGLISLSGAFISAVNLLALPDQLPANITDLSWMFYNAQIFNQDLSSWDVSSVTDMAGMFAIAYVFNGDISGWDVSSVVDMNTMFMHAEDFNQDIGSWDVSNVTSMSWMFQDNPDFNQNIGSWDVSNVTDMSWMFDQATSFNQDISGWCVEQIASEPENFSGFCPLLAEYHPNWGEECESPMVIHINTNHSDGTTMELPLFGNVDVTVDWGDGTIEDFTSEGLKSHTYAEENQFSISISGSLTQFGNNNASYSGVEKIDSVSSWGTLNLISLSGAFYGTSNNITENLIAVPNSIPNTVSNLDYMFGNASSFNDQIGGWDVSSVTDMKFMFYRASSFNQDISTWDVSSVKDMSALFMVASSFNVQS